jgi:hypothetical protein
VGGGRWVALEDVEWDGGFFETMGQSQTPEPSADDENTVGHDTRVSEQTLTTRMQ